MPNIVNSTTRISEVKQNDSVLSPRRYRVVATPGGPTVPLLALLEKDKPYQRGYEPGGDNYIHDSPHKFLRTAALQQGQITTAETPDASRNLRVPGPGSCRVAAGDVLLSKDSNIGNVAMVGRSADGAFHSAGIVKLNPTCDPHWLLAILQHPYLREQLDARVATGATIRHAGGLFVECQVLDPHESSNASIISDLAKTGAALENAIVQRHSAMIACIDDAYGVSTVVPHTKPVRLSTLAKSRSRFDAAPHSPRVRRVQEAFEAHGVTSLGALGVTSRRGPNLAETAIGKVLYDTEPHPGWYKLIRPAQISPYGTLVHAEYLGSTKTLPTVNQGEMVFGTEASLRTSVVFEAIQSCTTNFHGTVLKWDSGDLVDMAWLRNMLEYLRVTDILASLAVGGQGGHLSPEYFETIPLPTTTRQMRERIAAFYYQGDSGQAAGAWQLDVAANGVRAELRRAVKKAYDGEQLTDEELSAARAALDAANLLLTTLEEGQSAK